MRRRTLVHRFCGESVPDGAARRPRGALARLRGDKRGGAAIITAMAATSLLGVAGLTVEVGNWYLLRRNMQSAADAAAIAGALGFDNSGTEAAVTTVARGVTARNGFTHASSGISVDVAYAAGTGSVTVTVSQEQTGGLLRAAGFGSATKTVSARAVARVVNAGPRPCLHATTGAIDLQNNPNISATGCALVTNSPSADAMNLGNGQGTIRAASVISHGSCNGCEGAVTDGKLALPSGVRPLAYAPVTDNPYDTLSTGFSAPVSLICVPMPPVPRAGLTLVPGCYTSLTVRPNDTVNLTAGIYYIRSGALNINGTITGSGVSIVLIGQNGGAPGAIDISASANITLAAGTQPLNRDLDGVLLYRHAPNAVPSDTDIQINGNTTLRMRGAVVAPTSGLKVRGNAASGDPTAASCNVFIVGSVTFNGNPDFRMGVDGCDSYGVKNAQARIPRLME